MFVAGLLQLPHDAADGNIDAVGRAKEQETVSFGKISTCYNLNVFFLCVCVRRVNKRRSIQTPFQFVMVAKRHFCVF